MEILFGGKRCRGMGTSIGKLLLLILFLTLVGGGAFIHYTIMNSENRVIEEEELIFTSILPSSFIGTSP